MSENSAHSFVYLNWRANANANQKFHKDIRSTVETITSVGPYKHAYADFTIEKNNIYYWEIRIIQGNYFKIGVIKESEVGKNTDGSFSDNLDGYALFSTGKLRNGSNSTGLDFNNGFGPGDVVKVEFNSKLGTIKFGVNQMPLKVAFTNSEFKKGGYVPVVASLMEGSKYSLTTPILED